MNSFAFLNKLGTPVYGVRGLPEFGNFHISQKKTKNAKTTRLVVSTNGATAVHWLQQPAAAGAKKHSSPVLLDNNIYHSMAVKSTKLLTSQSHTVLQHNCSHSLNVPLNCNSSVPSCPCNSSASSGSVQRSVYTTDGGLALVYDIIQKMPYALSQTQHTASAVQSVAVIGMLFSQYKHCNKLLRGPARCLHLRQVPTSHPFTSQFWECWAAFFSSGALMSCALTEDSGVLHESCLFSGKRSDAPGRECPHLESFHVQSQLVVAHCSSGNTSLRDQSVPGKVPMRQYSFIKRPNPSFVLRNNPLTVKLRQCQLNLF